MIRPKINSVMLTFSRRIFKDENLNGHIEDTVNRFHRQGSNVNFRKDGRRFEHLVRKTI